MNPQQGSIQPFTSDGDAFALFSCLNETSVGVPDESRAAMGMALLFSGEAAAAEASAGWLLDPATVVRRAAANALGDAARKGKVTPTIAAPHDHDAELAAGG